MLMQSNDFVIATHLPLRKAPRHLANERLKPRARALCLSAAVPSPAQALDDGTDGRAQPCPPTRSAAAAGASAYFDEDGDAGPQ